MNSMYRFLPSSSARKWSWKYPHRVRYTAILSSADGSQSIPSFASLKIHGLMSAPRPTIAACAFDIPIRSFNSYRVNISPFPTTGIPRSACIAPIVSQFAAFVYRASFVLP